MCFTQSKWSKRKRERESSFILAIFGRSTSILNAVSSARTIGPAAGFIREEGFTCHTLAARQGHWSSAALWDRRATLDQTCINIIGLFVVFFYEESVVFYAHLKKTF